MISDQVTKINKLESELEDLKLKLMGKKGKITLLKMQLAKLTADITPAPAVGKFIKPQKETGTFDIKGKRAPGVTGKGSVDDVHEAKTKIVPPLKL